MPRVRVGDPVGHLWGLGLSPLQSQTLNGLVRNDVATIADLLEKNARDLLDIRSFGAGCLREARRALGSHGLALKGEEPWVPGDRDRA